jgi:hypothetical protein
MQNKSYKRKKIMTEEELQTPKYTWLEDAENDLRDLDLNKWSLKTIGGNEAASG